MDEIFGFFPPTSMPSSKIPMLTLLKQARAFGLGIVLTTQNPVDLDYKGLANCGTWFIGKLQTERDRARVIDGLKSTISGGSQEFSFSDMLDRCKKRVFIMYSIHQATAYLFETRWTLSYLRGPLTLNNIRSLMEDNRPPESSNLLKEATASPINFQGKELPLTHIPQYYHTSEVYRSGGKFSPSILAFSKLHFVDAKTIVDTWEERILQFPIDTNNQDPNWDSVQDISNQQEELTKDEPKDAVYLAAPESFADEKSTKLLSKAIASFLYQNQTLDIFYVPDCKLYSKPKESESDFRERLNVAMEEKRNGLIEKTNQEYESKLSALQERIRKGQAKKEQGEQQVFSQRLAAWISFATTLIGAVIGALFGKKRISQSTVSQTGTSIRKMGRIGKDQQTLSQTEASLEELQRQYQDLEQSRTEAIDKIHAETDGSKIALEKILLHPRKSDITITSLGLLWRRDENQA
jgi:hypothetical protein